MIAFFIINMIVLCNGANILIAPLDVGYHSRVTNMIKMGDILQQRGHKIHFLYNSKLQEMKLFKMAGKNTAGALSRFNVITYKPPQVDPGTADNTANMDWVNLFIGMSWSEVAKVIWPGTYGATLKSTLDDMNTWGKITEQSFDVIISDPVNFFSWVVSSQFDVPIIVYSNWGPMGWDLLYPINPSYVPVDLSNSHLSDTMDTWERFSNAWEFVRFNHYSAATKKKMKDICLNYKHIKHEACENIVDAKTLSLVLMNRNDALHYPAPFMPHIVSVEGFFLDKPRPLTGIFRDIVDRANDRGVIVASFGSLFRNLPTGMADIFAEAFAAMEQTVIWSYEGQEPAKLGKNTVISEWIPQRDLLAHKNVKLFVQHCGITGTFEALDSAVTGVGIPFLADQPYNCEKLANRVGSFKKIELSNLTSKLLQSAMTEVLNNATYKENAERAAAIYHDQPIEPRDKLVYWVEYVIRHKGAPHLRSHGINSLNIFQYLLLDIIGLFGVLACLAIIITTLFIRFIINMFRFSLTKYKPE